MAKRGRPKGATTDKTKKLYWTKDADAAILQYNTITDSRTRDRVFTSTLYRPIKKLATEVFKYVNFRKMPNWSKEDHADIISDCITLISSKLYLYTDITRSAFSYYQTAAKNFYIEEIRVRSKAYNLVSFENGVNEDEDHDPSNSAENVMFYEDPIEIMAEYTDWMVERIQRIKADDPDTKLIFSKIVEYLEKGGNIDLNGLRVFLINELVDTEILQDWKVDRLLYRSNIKLALVDRTTYREVKEGGLKDNNWEWIFEDDEQTPAQRERQNFFARKNSRKNGDQYKKKAKERLANETPEQRAERLNKCRIYKTYKEINKYTYENKKHNETPEEAEIRKAKARENYRAKRAEKIASGEWKPESKEQKSERLARARAAYHQQLKEQQAG